MTLQIPDYLRQSLIRDYGDAPAEEIATEKGKKVRGFP